MGWEVKKPLKGLRQKGSVGVSTCPVGVLTLFLSITFLLSLLSHWGWGNCLHWKSLHFALGHVLNVKGRNPFSQGKCSSCQPSHVASAELIPVY